MNAEEVDIGSSDSLWWKDIILSGNLEDGGINWFASLAKWKLGNGDAISFLKDNWIGDTPLKSRFGGLFSISSDKEGKIANMGTWNHNGWAWNLSWIRPLVEAESDMLSDMLLFISSASPDEGLEDKIKWMPDEQQQFPTSSCYSELCSMRTEPFLDSNLVSAVSRLWQTIIPSKVGVFG